MGGAGGSSAGTAMSTAPGSTTAPSTSRSTSPAGFTVAATLAQPRGQHSATLLNDGRILVVGGVNVAAQTADYVIENEVYDPVADAFTKTSQLGGNPGGYMTVASGTKSIPVARMLHAAVLLGDGRVLVAGGYGYESLDAQGVPIQGDLATAHAFDPRTNTFTQVGSLNFARRNVRAVVLPGGKVLIVGGVK